MYNFQCHRRHAVATVLGLVLGLPLANAQPQTAPSTAPMPASAASAAIEPTASAAVPATPASATATLVAAPLSPVISADVAPGPQVAPAPLDCKGLTTKAMAADMAALMAQSKKADLTEQSRLFNEAVMLWTQAQTQCSDHAKERAKRNRDDDLQMLERVLEKLDSGPQCAAAHKDAASLQDIAKQTLSERRWNEAAALFRKAESMWDYAAERCTGSQQEVAQRRREQSAQDGHNAQFCAPLFEKAREHTQRLRAAATLAKADKQDAQMVAETLWRDALAQCRGAAVQEIAANNANALARERGTPWVPRQAPESTLAETTPTLSVPAAEPGHPASVPAANTLSEVKMAGQGAKEPVKKDEPSVLAKLFGAAPSTTTQALVPAAAAPATATATAATAAALTASPAAPVLPAKPVVTAPPEPTQAQPGDVIAGDTRYIGRFYRDANATTVSGQGKVSWTAGGTFEGQLVQGKRQGTGTMVWPDGQRYTGTWVDDVPQGEGKLHFANGNDYEGIVVKGIPQGAGHMRYASGDTYDGLFHRGEPDRSGTYVWRNGQRYEGAWKDGQPDGAGKLKFASGNLYEGTVSSGVPQGKGRMVYAAGEVYEGDFAAGQPHGQGTFTWTNGDRYVGQWAAGKKHGKGVFTWASGERWEGEYDNDAQKN